MDLPRRDFLKAMAAVSGAALVGPSLLTTRAARAQSTANEMTDDITTGR
ncbi:MAG: twin-arginine translocation signal domain-containing protein [Roseovarius sp.]|nr:twin-arginine translocation signal domain-containing protein [Roseovarius sp.]